MSPFWLSRWLCPHPTMLRVRHVEDGSYSLSCAECGYTVPALARTEAERQTMAASFPPIRTRGAVKQKRVKTARIEPMRRIK